MRESDEPTLSAPADRRRNARFMLGLPVKLHLAGVLEPLTVEVMDLSACGGRFRSATQTARLHQNAAIMFLLPGPRRCLAKGRVVRTEASGEFALHLDRVNEAFMGFIGEFTR
ncbi:MAG: PilZ domain-containing protein [Deltaproteobacteria bacterium]|nr:PilZ domain-containing protein [Deltaproteobacteria bacterium]